MEEEEEEEEEGVAVVVEEEEEVGTRAYSVRRGFPGSSLRPGTEGPGPGLEREGGAGECSVLRSYFARIRHRRR